MFTFVKYCFLFVATSFFLPSIPSCYEISKTSKDTFAGLETYNNLVSNETDAALPGRILLNTSGKVYSINKGKKISATSNSKRVKVTVTKTGGKAKTKISIITREETSLDFPIPLRTVKKQYTFENGNYTRTKTFTIFKAKDKEIEVLLDNKSFSNTFDYTLKVEEI
ncbi:MAG: hypothetical protein AAF242_04285 [Bacteroidota bacterium]